MLAIPCNTAHYFYDRLAAALPVPVLNMPELTVAEAKAAGCRKLGVLATDGTLLAGTYQLMCERAGLAWAVPGEAAQKNVMSIIYDQNQGRAAGADAAMWCGRPWTTSKRRAATRAVLVAAPN